MSEKNNNIFMGIDVSKATLDISLSGQHFKIKNETKAISTFIKTKIACTKVMLCVLESTGGYEKLVTKLLQASDVPVHRAHPNVVKAFGRASKYFAKTDKIDAKLLASYAAFVSDTEHGDEPISEIQEELMQMRSMERNLEDSLHMYQCRIKHLSGPAKIFAAQHIDFIKKQLKELIQQVKDLIASDKQMTDKINLLTSFKGVGYKTARVLVTELPELGKADKKEIAALVGVAPQTHESGTKISKGHIYGGRFHVRKAIYMAALSAMTRNPTMAALYKKMKDAGKASKIALVAIMRKIIVCLNAMVQSNKIYINEA